MALFSRDPHEHWPKQHFSENEVANSGYIRNQLSMPQEYGRLFDVFKIAAHISVCIFGAAI